MAMSVRLDADEEAMLDALAGRFGSQSEVVRVAIRRLAAEERRRDALAEFSAAWVTEHGPFDEGELALIDERLFAPGDR
jgi:Arc/MetJ-type ribon-helix-helix transcriptional regulator